MSSVFNIFIVLCLLYPLSVSHAQENAQVTYRFTRTDAGYSFYGSFQTTAKTECLLNICFEQEHLRSLVPTAKEVKQVGRGENWNQISYTFQEFIVFKNTSVWSRTFYPEKQRIDFELLSSTNNLAIMPNMLSSSGYYQIKQEEGHSIVSYFQKCQLTDVFVNEFYLEKVKEGAIDFMHRFSRYASSHCVSSNIDKLP